MRVDASFVKKTFHRVAGDRQLITDLKYALGSNPERLISNLESAPELRNRL